MKISEYIVALEKLREANGDLEVETVNSAFDRVSAPSPELGYRKILLGRESKPGFWSKWSSREGRECKGEPVIRV